MSAITQSPPQPQAADQADILAQNERLTADLTSANQLLTEAQSSLTTANAERDQFQTQLTTANDNLATARGEITQLKAQLDEARNGNTSLQEIVTTRTRERDDLKSSNDQLTTRMADFNKAVAAEVAKLGITKTAVQHDPAGSGQAEAKPKSLTEECRTAKGT